MMNYDFWIKNCNSKLSTLIFLIGFSPEENPMRKRDLNSFFIKPIFDPSPEQIALTPSQSIETFVRG